MNEQDSRYTKFINSIQIAAENILGFDVIKVKDVALITSSHKAFDLNTDRLCQNCIAVYGGDAIGDELYTKRGCSVLGIVFDNDEHGFNYYTFYCGKYEAKDFK